VDIRDSKWLEWGYPSLDAKKIEPEANGPKQLPN
jgi:hypothetical protein